MSKKPRIWDKILTKEFLEKEYIQNKKTLKEIAIEIGSNDMTVRRYVQYHNLPLKNIRKISKTELIKQKFNRLTVIGYHSTDSTGTRWVCKCDCGKLTVARRSCLQKNKHKSCGCLAWETHWKGYGEIPGKLLSSLKRGAKSRDLEFTVSNEYIWNLFLTQDRKCYYTGLPIYFDYKEENNRTASLDRIDNTKGYIKDNVVWCHKDINFMKCDMSKQEFIDYCKLVTEKFK